MMSRRFLKSVSLVGSAILLSFTSALPAQSAVLNWLGFGFSKTKFYEETLVWVDRANNPIAIKALTPIAPPLAVGLRLLPVLVRGLDPPAISIISGRATFGLDPNENILAAGWFGEFGADPTAPAPAVDYNNFEFGMLQTGCNPAMVSCGVSVNQQTGKVVFEFNWGASGFIPTLNLDTNGHFNFAAIYSIPTSTSGANFGLIGTQGDVDAMGVDAPTYMLCSSGWCGEPPVPESPTWAMMIAGFGSVGAMMRRSRTVRRLRYILHNRPA